MLVAANSKFFGWEVPGGNLPVMISVLGVGGFLLLATTATGATAAASAGAATLFLDNCANGEEQDHSQDQQYDDICNGHGIHLLSNSA